MYDQIKDLLRNNSFSKSHYRIDSSVIDLPHSFQRYCSKTYESQGKPFDEDDGSKSLSESVELMTPDFQRSNDKWTLQMKQSFVENLLKGCQSTLFLYTLTKDYNKGGYYSLKIIDGLQRLTAISDFMDNKFTIFNEIEPVFYSELRESKVLSYNQTIGVRIYKFDSEAEAVQFYIDMNENITHASADIIKAKHYLRTLQ